jgi:hypothetical protein
VNWQAVAENESQRLLAEFGGDVEMARRLTTNMYGGPNQRAVLSERFQPAVTQQADGDRNALLIGNPPAAVAPFSVGSDLIFS